MTELAALVTDDECGAFADATLVPLQTISSPAGEGLLMNHEGGFINAAVLEPPYTCDDILAIGRVKNSWHDNDVYAWLFDHDRANAWGGGVSGRVGRFKVMWELHAVWGGIGNPDFHGAFVERISIR